MPESSDFDVLVVGGAGVDTIVRVDRLEIPGSDSVGVPPVHDYAGHTGSGVALGCHRLGLRTKFLDFLGDDPQAELVLAAFRRAGLDFSHLVSPAGTPRGVNLVDADGLRFSFYDGRHPADLRLPSDFYLPFLERARHVHLSITNINRDMHPDIERLGATSSTDLHAWDGVNEHHRHYALRADLVFLSAAGLGGRPEEVMRGVLAGGRARLVVATAGADGSYLLERGETEVRHVPAVDPGRPVVDSNGAGDAFVSGFLDSWLAGRPAEECMLAGSVAGAHACTTAGTHGGLIDAEGLAAGLAAAKTGRP
ncbi:carbohydrate kinase family protein [Kitasatospora sp. KL5]|uniref:carbohydrate kinase family protein n=1 Tax=Kitasatospora sp. KL5 TaxID=3425125 RepID=UPI003D6DE0CB